MRSKTKTKQYTNLNLCNHTTRLLILCKFLILDINMMQLSMVLNYSQVFTSYCSTIWHSILTMTVTTDKKINTIRMSKVFQFVKISEYFCLILSFFLSILKFSSSFIEWKLTKTNLTGFLLEILPRSLTKCSLKIITFCVNTLEYSTILRYKQKLHYLTKVGNVDIPQ